MSVPVARIQARGWGAGELGVGFEGVQLVLQGLGDQTTPQAKPPGQGWRKDPTLFEGFAFMWGSFRLGPKLVRKGFLRLASLQTSWAWNFSGACLLLVVGKGNEEGSQGSL